MAAERPARERNPDLPVWIYRATSAALLLALLAVLGFTGGRILSSIDGMAIDVSAVRDKLARFEARMDAVEQRLQRVEAATDSRWRYDTTRPGGGQ